MGEDKAIFKGKWPVLEIWEHGYCPRVLWPNRKAKSSR